MMDRLMASSNNNLNNREPTHSLDNTTNTNYSPANARMVENVLLIWLDNNIDELNDVDCANTLIQLRWIVNNTHVFTDEDKSIDFIYKNKHEKICMIISGSLGQNIVPVVHSISHVDSIFIYCGNKSLHEIWVKKWPKIKGVYTVITPICETLSQIVKNYEHSSISIYYMNPNNHNSSKSNAHYELYLNFLITHVMKELIMKMNFNNSHLKQWITFCQKNLITNENDSKNIDILEKKYFDLSPIWFYVHDYFLSSTLNRSLSLFNINILIKLSFFIYDLHEQIKRLHYEQFIQSNIKQTFTVYHGQRLYKTPAEQMIQTKDGFIVFNGFLCASSDRRLSQDFAHHAMKNPDFVGLLFVISIDPSKTTVPFAFINNITGFEGKDEIIFPMHTVFRIRDIQSMGENNRLIQVGLTLSNENNDNLYGSITHINQDIPSNIEGWHHLGQLIFKLELYQKAEEIYNILFQQTTREKEREHFHHQLKKIKDAEKKHKSNGLYLDETYHSLTTKIDEEALSQGFQARTADTDIENDSIVSNPFNMQKWQKNIELLKKKLFVMK